MTVSRRDFLKTGLSGLAYFSAAATVPAWVAKSAQALSKGLDGDRILVLVQQSGGNDGLNTVIPYTDPMYNGDLWRPNLHITSGLDATTLDGLNALHPKMTRLKDWWDNGNMAVVQRVGYPNPSLSHFVSMDYWESGASPGSATAQSANGRKGWAARFFDNQCAGTPAGAIDPLSMLAAGKSSVPRTFQGSDLYTPPAVSNPKSYTFSFPSDRVRSGTSVRGYSNVVKHYTNELAGLAPVNDEADFLQRSYNLVQASVDDIAAAAAVEPAIGAAAYPATSLGRGLDLVSKIIRGGFGTKIFYVSQGGYDTHSGQFTGANPGALGRHAELLEEFDQSLHAFLTDMALTGNLDKVLVLSFSEFGRRVAENGSAGTDHGTGNCLFALGGRVRKGVYGGQPQLDEDTVQDNKGNLAHAIDFRAVYGRVVQDWLGGDPVAVYNPGDWALYGLEEDMAQVDFLKGPAPNGDVNGSGAADAVDVQLVVNAALGVPMAADTDVNGDGATNAVDVQLVVNAALGVSGDKAMPEKAAAIARKRRSAA